MPLALSRQLLAPIAALLLSLAAVATLSAGAGAQTRGQFEDEVQRILVQSDQAYARGQYQRSIEFAQAGADLAARSLGNHSYTALGYFCIGRGLIGLGRTAEALPHFERALDLFQRMRGLERNAADTLNSIAIAYEMLDRFQDSEATHLRALDIRRRLRGPEAALDVAQTLQNLAGVYKSQGKPTQAIAAYGQALDLLRKTPGAPATSIASMLHNLGAMQHSIGRADLGEPLLVRAIELHEGALPKDHPTWPIVYSDLALIYLDQGRKEQAEKFFRTAMRALDAMPQLDNRTTAIVAEQFGKFLAAEGRDAAETERILKRAVEANRHFAGEGSVQFSFTLEALAKFYGKQRRFDEAQKLVDEVRRIRDKSLPADHSWTAEAIGLSGSIAADRGDWATARGLLMRATSAVDPSRRQFNTLRELEALLIRATWNIARGSNARERAALTTEAFTAAQRALSSKAGDMVASMTARDAPGDSELAKAVRETQDAMMAFLAAEKRLTQVQAVDSKASEAAIAQLRAEMRRAGARHDEAAALLVQRFPGYREYALRPTVPLEAIQHHLKGDEALVVYVVAEPESFVFVVTREAVDWKKIDKGREALGREVSDFRVGLEVEVAASDAPLFDLGRAHALYRLLLAPLEETLKGKRHLLVVPSGALTSVPFHLMVTDAPATPKPSRMTLDAYRKAAWLARTYAVSVLPTVSSLKSLRELPASSHATKPMIGFGNPVFAQTRLAEGHRGKQKTVVAVAGRSRGYKSFWQGDQVDLEALRANLLPLPETEEELKTVAARVGAASADVLLGAKATEAAVKRLNLTPYRIVYFATHGLVAGEVGNLAEPALALTLPRAASPLDDGLLTSSEIAMLKLNADWVVLSACNTAAGDKTEAEALSGLASAFFFAGAKALLVSHWAVGSVAAVRITTATFEELQKAPAAGRAEAVRLAMLAYLSDASSDWNGYPAFWAPFSMVGDGG